MLKNTEFFVSIQYCNQEIANKRVSSEKGYCKIITICNFRVPKNDSKIVKNLVTLKTDESS